MQKFFLQIFEIFVVGETHYENTQNLFKINCKGTSQNQWFSFNFFIINSEQVLHIKEAVAQRCPVKKVFLEISQNSQEDACARDYFLINLQASDSGLRTTFLKEHLRWLLQTLILLILLVTLNISVPANFMVSDCITLS